MRRSGTKTSRNKKWRKELKASWSRKAHRRDKLEAYLKSHPEQNEITKA
jgi:hypothetical protein